MVFQIRKGKTVLGEYKDKKEAGRELAKKLYNYPRGLSLVQVKKKK